MGRVYLSAWLSVCYSLAPNVYREPWQAQPELTGSRSPTYNLLLLALELLDIPGGKGDFAVEEPSLGQRNPHEEIGRN